MVEDAALSPIIEVEVGVVREIDERCPVGLRLHFDRKLAALLQRECAGYLYAARKAHHAGRVGDLQSEKILPKVGHLPDAAVEALRATMQRVRAVVSVSLVELGVEAEAAAGNTVGVTPDGRANIVGLR